MAVRVFKNRQFARWAKREHLMDKALCAAVREIERGLVDARLGGYLLKKRIAKDHKDKSGGLRTILAYRQEARLVSSSVLRSEKGQTSTRWKGKFWSNSAARTWR
jgi:hypothetical protein